MRNIFLFIPFLLLSFSASAQEQDPCYSINDFITQLDIKPPISYQLSIGWNMVGYTGAAENSGIVNQINGALSNDSSVENTFQVIKNVSGQFWSSAFAQITSFTQGEGYMMYVISDTAPSLSFNSAVNIPEIIGCTDCTAENFNAWATSDDSSCTYTIYGCTDEDYIEFNPLVSEDDGSCSSLIYSGCTYPLAINYNTLANIEDGSCIYFQPELLSGGGNCSLPIKFVGNTGSNMTVIFPSPFISSLNITDENAYIVALNTNGLVVGSTNLGSAYLNNGNFSVAIWGDDYATQEIDGAQANELISFQLVNGLDLYDVQMATSLNYSSNGLVAFQADAILYNNCTALLLACPYDNYNEYSSAADIYDVSACLTVTLEGCTSELYLEYNPAANRENGDCLTLIVEGCTYSSSSAFNPEANIDNGSCIVYGCLDSLADNYNPLATIDVNNCIYYGCVNYIADNYNINANTDDGTCIIYGCILNIFPNYNSEATIDNGSCDLNSTDIVGCTEAIYYNYNPLATINNGLCSNYFVGNQLEGGIVFYVDESGQHGLVAAMDDLGEFEWGCFGTTISGADSHAHGTGYQNTLEIVAECSETNTAAYQSLNATTEGYTDWFLPSKDELLEMYKKIGQGSEIGNMGGFEDAYWSSSELSNNLALSVIFNTSGPGNYSFIDKDVYNKVRCIRAF